MLFDVTDYRHDGSSSSPDYGSAPSVRRSGIGALAATMPTPHSGATEKLGRYATANNPFPVAHVIRDHRRRDLLASIAEWERASGPDRVWWRRDARHRLAEWRRLYRQPERRAFEAAVARSQATRP